MPHIVLLFEMLHPTFCESDNKGLWLRLIKLILFLLSKFETNLRSMYLNSIIMSFIAKSTNTTLKSCQNCNEKLEQVRAWKSI